MASGKKSVGAVIVAFALAVMMIAMGISTVTSMDVSSSANSVEKAFKGLKNAATNATSQNEIVQAINSITSNIENYESRHNTRVVLVIIIGILEIAAGVLVIVNFFMPYKRSALKNCLMWIVFALWCLVLVLVDITGGNGIMGNAFKNSHTCLAWLASLSTHALILGAILIAKD